MRDPSGVKLFAVKFPILHAELGELTEPAKRLVATLEMIPLARFMPSGRGWIGRPSKDRLAIASAFVAKAVYGFNTTRQLLEAPGSDTQLREICGWQESRQVPHEATFSRAFDEFARVELPQFRPRDPDPGDAAGPPDRAHRAGCDGN